MRLSLTILAACAVACRLPAQTRTDTAVVMRIIVSAYRGPELRVRALADTGSDPASRATLARLFKVPRQAPMDRSLPGCSWVATPPRGTQGVELTLEEFALDKNEGRAVVSVICAQPGAAIGDVYFMRRQFKLRKSHGRWRALPGGRVEVTQAGGDHSAGIA